MNLYLKIKDLLLENKIYRNDYHELLWRIWEDEQSVTNNYLTRSNFMKATRTETIRRTKQHVVKQYPELKADPEVLKKNRKIEKMKGYHVFNDPKKEMSIESIKAVLFALVEKWKSSNKSGADYDHDKLIYQRYVGKLKEKEIDPVKNFEKDLLG